jgi:hypothetical protein
MPRFEVRFDYVVTIEVEAASPEEAMEKAKDGEWEVKVSAGPEVLFHSISYSGVNEPAQEIS